ncbi:MAG: double zinc ribbon domain-containing protein, partial [Candidatus Helarchaeota archaeon]
GRELLCPECKSKIHPNWIYCKYCGVKIKDTERVESRQADQKVHTYVTCPRCGNQVNTSWKYCKWCGNKFTSE